MRLGWWVGTWRCVWACASMYVHASKCVRMYMHACMHARDITPTHVATLLPLNHTPAKKRTWEKEMTTYQHPPTLYPSR